MCPTDVSDGSRAGMSPEPSRNDANTDNVQCPLSVPRQDTPDHATAFSNTDPDDSGRPESQTEIMAARAYQLEMFERSLKGNVIVAVGYILALILFFPC